MDRIQTQTTGKRFYDRRLCLCGDVESLPCGAACRPNISQQLVRRHQPLATTVSRPYPDRHMIGELTHADTILDRLVHGAIKPELKGESMRKKRNALAKVVHSR